ncbi:MAG: hypothetical protein KAY24_19730, partial [Candidatus Eisenbacteria sp.]|nr:hypothetical protein [Candidatus Eisenbacteria bacterium]
MPETELAADESQPVRHDVELDIWIVGLFDVLGFKNMYRRLGPHAMHELYQELIKCVQESVETTAVGMRGLASGEKSPLVFHFKLGAAHFSDTIMLWAPLTPTHISPFLARCADLVAEAIKRGVPLRGAIAAGEAILDTDEGTYLGTPIIDAARLERAQDWIGVSLAHTCTALLQHVDSDLVLPYTPPCKPGARVLHAGVVLDWPRRVRNTATFDVAAAIRKMNSSSRYAKYYDNTESFIRHSEKRHDWNRDQRIPIVMGALRRAILRQGCGNEPLPGEAKAILQTIESADPSGPLIALCFRAIAQGHDLPTEASSLPAESREFLEQLQQVCSGPMIDIDAALLSALEARSGVRACDAHLLKALDPTNDRDEYWSSCVPFVQAVADGKPLPPIPPDLPPELGEVMENVQRAANGESMPIDLEALIAGVIWCNTTHSDLSEENHSRIKALRRVGLPWGDLADFLEAVAHREDVQPDLSKFDEVVLSTIRVVNQLLAWQKAVRYSFTEAVSRNPSLPVSSHELVAVVSALGAQNLS